MAKNMFAAYTDGALQKAWEIGFEDRVKTGKMKRQRTRRSDDDAMRAPVDKPPMLSPAQIALTLSRLKHRDVVKHYPAIWKRLSTFLEKDYTKLVFKLFVSHHKVVMVGQTEFVAFGTIGLDSEAWENISSEAIEIRIEGRADAVQPGQYRIKIIGLA